MNEDGTFKKVQFLGKELAGKAYFDEINEAVNKAYMTKSKELIDIMWFLWLSPESPFFGKDKMATFESYFVKDAKAHKENKNPYYTLSEDEKYCNKILTKTKGGTAMKTVRVCLDSIDKVKGFVNDISRFNTDFDLISGRYVIDAKSIMGIFSLDLSKPIELTIHESDEIDEILKALQPYVVD